MNKIENENENENLKEATPETEEKPKPDLEKELISKNEDDTASEDTSPVKEDQEEKKIEEARKEQEYTTSHSEEKEKSLSDIPQDILNLLDELPDEVTKEKLPGLPVQYLKEISPEIAKKLENILGIRQIADLPVKPVTKEKLHMLNLMGITEDALEKWQSMANFIVKSVQGTLERIEKKKILLAGLNNAGKTAILNILTKRFNITNLKPTKNVDVAQLTSENITFNIWDMGGQEEYRKIYVAHPERFFINVHFVIYVIDIQDRSTYPLALSYLRKIMDILKSFGEYPDFIVFLHKADPSIYETIQNALLKMENQVHEIFKDQNFHHRIFHTSIYNTILTDSTIFDSLSNLFEISNREETSPDLINSIQLILNNLISFSYLVEEKFQYYEQRLDNIEAQNRNLLNALSTGQYKDVAPVKAVSKRAEPRIIPPREALTNELKMLFRKRRIR
ncbi:MAG: ADP-ribosylation factor-like protein [Candidatus Helarchaeota archaeon]